MIQVFGTAALLALQAVTGASPQTGAPPPPVVFESAGMRLTVEEVAKIDGVVWAMDFIDQSTMIFTERSGQLNLMSLDDWTIAPIAGAPVVQTSDSGGLFDVTIDPLFADNGWVYLTYIKPLGDTSATAVARGRLKDGRLTDLEDLFVANNDSDELAHWGSRVVMDASRYIYITVGDRHIPNNAQNLASHGGKVIRLHEDGRVPADNPFVDRDDAAPEVWSYGHRNPQGLAVQPGTGVVFEQEHGPTGGDEINILAKGRNYGWPVITYGENIWGGQTAAGTAAPGMEQPLHYWKPGNAPTGLTFYRGSRYPEWQGDLFSGTLRGQIHRLTLDWEDVINEERLFSGAVDRIRDIIEGPDGLLYFSTESGRISRIVPVE
jgi:glucose/arabinose dehydrogenase